MGEKPNKRIGGEGRNRPDFPAVAPLICLISLGIQAKSVLSARIVFNPFGVRFGVRLQLLIYAVGVRLVAPSNHFFPSSVVW